MIVPHTRISSVPHTPWNSSERVCGTRYHTLNWKWVCGIPHTLWVCGKHNALQWMLKKKWILKNDARNRIFASTPDARVMPREVQRELCLFQSIWISFYSCKQIILDPWNFEAGRKFSFEIKKHENPIIVWNYLSTISFFWWIIAVSGYFQIGLGCFLLLPKSQCAKLFVHSCSSHPPKNGKMEL